MLNEKCPYSCTISNLDGNLNCVCDRIKNDGLRGELSSALLDLKKLHHTIRIACVEQIEPGNGFSFVPIMKAEQSLSIAIRNLSGFLALCKS